MSAGQQVASPDGSSADTASARQQPVSASAIADIVVTAQKRAERINDVPLSITANSAPELKAAGVSSPDDLGKLVPGFVYAKSAYGVPVYTLRGIGFYDYGLAALPAVTVYVDEVPLPYGQLTAFSLLDVQRVETLKGPQGTLYGVGSTAGAINIIAASPTPSLAAGLDLTYARFNQVTVDGFISGPLTSTLQGRFAFHTENGGAWQRSYTRKDRLGDKRITSGRLLLDWAPTSAFSARLNVNAGIDRSDTQALQYEGPTTLPSTNATLLRLNPSLYNYPRAPENNRAADWDVNYPFRSDNHNFQAALTANYDINADLTLKSITSFNRFTTTSSVDGDGTNQQDATILVDGKIRVFFQELRLSGTYDNGLRWIIGANFQDDKVDQRQDGFLTRSTQGLPVPGATHNASFSFQNAQSKAVYANVEFSVVDGLTAQGGVRYTKSDRDLKGCSTAQDQNTANFFGPRVGAVIPVGGCYTRRPDGTVGFYTTSLNQDNVSWRAGLDWKVNRDVMLYANVSHGYKQGGFPIVGASSYLSLQPAVQEDVLAYETGAKLTLLDGAVQFNTAAFYNDYTNKQVRGRVIDPATNAQASALVNVPKSKIYGGELQLTLRPVQQLTLNADATYIKTKITSSFLNFDFIAQRVQMKGQVLPFSPKLTFNVRADYQPPINSDWNAVFGVAVKHQSSSFGGLGELAVARNKAFTTLDLRAGVKSADDRWNISVFGRNVTNTYYWTAPALIIDTLGRYAGAPATYGVTVSFRY
ncbi:TonB-dependent receptor [Sphingobium subterraneum]|uniref:Outer membrane receptor protein involved in Fe transport n=1 Tax=Sphingobium subterraneum TaxID=627688 RepID=A0A841IWE4_9SPHN|nr:TonB-dependent receptor [Sphingobium subterraneum]MBB6122957.1 outer membrane receptor protein involved in Fe transport [Sphingobium subterraneum]